MSRLIDAEEFRRLLSEIQTDAEHYDNTERRAEIGVIMALLDKQPTAYNVDNVVKELEEELRVTRIVQTMECIKNDGYGSPLQAKYGGKIEMLLKAIDIVKTGGVASGSSPEEGGKCEMTEQV